MPVPLNAPSEVVRAWLEKSLGYMLDDTIPVKPKGVKARTHMDIDFVGIHPSLKQVQVGFGAITLKPRIIVEVKGWIDYNSSEILKNLYRDLNLMKKNNFIPSLYSKKKQRLTFTFLKQEIYQKGNTIFGIQGFDRVLAVPEMPQSTNIGGNVINKINLINSYKLKSIYIIELTDILNDLIKYVHDTANLPVSRRSFVLEMIYMFDKAKLLC